MSAGDAAAAQLATLLAALTQPDTNAIREAEVALKPLLKDSRSVPPLVEVLKSRGTQVRSKVMTYGGAVSEHMFCGCGICLCHVCEKWFVLEFGCGQLALILTK